MKPLFVLIVPAFLMACGESKKEEPTMVKKVVCADSVEQALYDTLGNVYTVKVPGPCDTVLVPAAEN